MELLRAIRNSLACQAWHAYRMGCRSL